MSRLTDLKRMALVCIVLGLLGCHDVPSAQSISERLQRSTFRFTVTATEGDNGLLAIKLASGTVTVSVIQCDDPAVFKSTKTMYQRSADQARASRAGASGDPNVDFELYIHEPFILRVSPASAGEAVVRIVNKEDAALVRYGDPIR